jgi:hypothetical protein
MRIGPPRIASVRPRKAIVPPTARLPGGLGGQRPGVLAYATAATESAPPRSSARAGGERRAGGDHVVDENRLGRDASPRAKVDAALYAAEPRGTRAAHLGRFGPGPLQAVRERASAARGELRGDPLGLVEASPPQAHRVQRHRHQARAGEQLRRRACRDLRRHRAGHAGGAPELERAHHAPGRTRVGERRPQLEPGQRERLRGQPAEVAAAGAAERLERACPGTTAHAERRREDRQDAREAHGPSIPRHGSRQNTPLPQSSPE